MPTQAPRPNLSQTVQQFDATEASALVAKQIEPFAAAGTMDGQSDLASLDASGGAFALTLPSSSDVVLGKPYTFAETDGTNPVTLTASGTGTIDGSATLLLAAGSSVTLIPIDIAETGDEVTWIAEGTQPVAGGDATAIHVDVAGEIAGIAAKATPVNADLVVIEDSAAANAKKSATLGSLPYYNKVTSGEIAATALKAAPVAADTLLINDSAAADALASVTIGSLPVAQAQVSSTVVQVASDGAAAILNTTGGIQLANTAVGSKAITTTSSYAGQKVNIVLLAAAGGDYTLALDVGTLTFNAAAESAVVMRNAGNTAWVCVGLSGATIV